MSNDSANAQWFASVFFAIVGSVIVSACGGGGAASSTTTTISMRVIDGYVSGATVCLDANLNGVCDANETQGVTDSAGNVTLKVPNADVGKYPIIASVPVGAIDADDPTNPVSIAYALRAPKDTTGVISPLTTLVQTLVEAGASTQNAALVVQQQTGTANVFGDYIQAKENNTRAFAKVLVRLSQAKLTELAPLIGTSSDLINPNSKDITQADLDLLIRKTLAHAIPTVWSQLPTSCVTAIDAICSNGIASLVNGANGLIGLSTKLGVSVSNAPALVGVQKRAAPTASESSGTPGATLRWLAYTDASNWSYGLSLHTAAEGTTDSNGLRHYRSLKVTDTEGTVTQTSDIVLGANDQHWNGRTWVPACDVNTLNAQTERDTNGSSSGNVCDGYEKGTSHVTEVDYSGKSIADLVNAIRSFPGSGNGRANGKTFAAWGSSDGNATTALVPALSSTATLPQGSKLLYSDSIVTDLAWSYSDTALRLTNADVAKGGDATVNNGNQLACADSSHNGYSVSPANLETLISNNHGHPCIFGAVNVTGLNGANIVSSGNSEWWDQSTLPLGIYCPSDVSCAARVSSWSQASALYTGRKVIRAAFADSSANSAVTYFACDELSVGGSSTNCQSIGGGTYTITPAGAARVLTFQGMPGPTRSLLGSQRIFVEANSAVWYGYMGLPFSAGSVGLNLTAANALFNALGIAPIAP